MTPSIANDFLTDSGLGANTDWIVTFPTKRFYVDAGRYARAPSDPFVEAFYAGQSRLTFGIASYDREELPAPHVTCGSGCPAVPINDLPYEVNVFGFIDNAPAGTPSGVLGSRLSSFYQYLTGGTRSSDTGWAAIDLFSSDGGHILPRGTLSTGEAVTIHGLPAIGFMVYNVVNADAQPGVLGNYGGVFAHRSTLACSDIDGLPCPNVND